MCLFHGGVAGWFFLTLRVLQPFPSFLSSPVSGAPTAALGLASFLNCHLLEKVPFLRRNIRGRQWGVWLTLEQRGVRGAGLLHSRKPVYNHSRPGARVATPPRGPVSDAVGPTLVHGTQRVTRATGARLVKGLPCDEDSGLKNSDRCPAAPRCTYTRWQPRPQQRGPYL